MASEASDTETPQPERADSYEQSDDGNSNNSVYSGGKPIISWAGVKKGKRRKKFCQASGWRSSLPTSAPSTQLSSSWNWTANAVDAMISSFRKPNARRFNARTRIRSSSSDEEAATTAGSEVDIEQQKSDNGARDKKKQVDEDESLSEVQQNIAKFKQKRKEKKPGLKSTVGSGYSKEEEESKVRSNKSTPLLSFHHEEDDEEVFQVKKSSQSRRLIKQKKAEKKKRQKPEADDDEDDVASSKNGQEADNGALSRIPGPELDRHRKSNVLEPELDIKFKDTLPERKPREEITSWTLSGKEAEALHMEEEDLDEDESEDEQRKAGPSEPLKEILQSGAIPDAAAIHLARKRRQEARERSTVADESSQEFIPVNRSHAQRSSRLVRDEEEDKDSSDERISFTGVTSAARDRQLQQVGLHREDCSAQEEDEDEGKDDWEEMQIRKAMMGTQLVDINFMQQQQQQQLPMQQQHPPMQQQHPVPGFPGYHSNTSTLDSDNTSVNLALRKPVSYNLQGIKARLKERLESKREVYRRHQNDADRAVDELVNSQGEIDRLQLAIPRLSDRHAFYQDLRGYVTDLVECFNEKIVSITYLEDKLNKSRSNICSTLMERRRQDVRDQMIELSAKPSNVAAPQAQLSEAQQKQEALAESQRQRRAAEREGRRRRRAQQRQAAQSQATIDHHEGMSSDDELSTLDQAALSKIRQDVENQARQVLADVVDDFSTFSGVKERLEEWKQEDNESYVDAYVSLCLPKIFSPLVRLNLLFWSPFTEKNDIEHMEWYEALSTFSFDLSETTESLRRDPDRNLISLLVEKVVMPKITSLVRASYDPLSTTQTVRLTKLIKDFIVKYHSLKGDSKQMREFILAVKDKLKDCIDQDPYIPIGYSKKIIENRSGPHAIFVQRQFWACFKLLRNTLSWSGIICDSVLADLAINSLLNRYLLIALGLNPDPQDVASKAKDIISILPAEWRRTNMIVKSELQGRIEHAKRDHQSARPSSTQ